MGKVRDLADLGDNVNDVVNGSAKAWVNFNGTGTIAVGDNLNVASLTDNATGDYTINFTSAMANVNYSYVGSASQAATGTSSSQDSFQLKDLGSYKVAASIRGETTYVSSTANRTNFDMAEVNVVIHGDLA